METERKKRKPWLVIMICAVLTLFVAAGVGLWAWLSNEFTLQITLNGAPEITVEVGTSYEDPGAQARFWGKNYNQTPTDVDVSQKSEVDSSKLGTYEVTYTAGHRGLRQKAVRKVHVVDTQAPEIVLTADPETYTLPGHTYVEEGFAATDNYDGDLTGKVTSKEEDGVVTYTVTDASGNTATAQRTIVYNDPNPPVLTLVGDAAVSIKAGSTYQDLGCTAVDDCQGDISDAVTVSGSVDPYQSGSYEITYSATDDYGNTGTVTRTVTVLPLTQEDIAEPNGKVIYLTFDDGPGPHTERLLDMLAKYDVKVSFFVVNTGYISVIGRAAKEGHTVAIHSATHRFEQIYRSDDAYFADLHKMQSIIEQHTGTKSMLLRFPGGSSNGLSRSYSKGIMTRLTAAVRSQGYQYFDWNVDSNDAGGASTAEEVFQNVVSGVKKHNNSVVLQHDIKGFSVDAVEKIIVWGLTNGYRFQPLTLDSPGCHHRILN